MAKYYTDKSATANMVKEPFPTPEGYTYTILRPATCLSNFLPPGQTAMYPTLAAQEPLIPTAHKPSLQLSYLDPADIDCLVARSISNPTDFANKTVPFASINMTMFDIAAAYGSARITASR
ncbi:uncharacterized protein Z518_08596 [Rhinocladiella mackenziei CBS 650.93]|uniref:NmrA-like domain-containing protein n=1 Tax=Rhinocladiella mackenziei CBS 650.93 TaxID=1442369 RepID=A0A0D2I9S7_9EURO|nr:uncharacterized protein Z518_08596 [Rhinocladiella mackenziei CBS 650.93]KIX02654.1 hypothetical protein Z518_08596 [Rhinocladiella mackenziei CBS 650.93]